MALYKYSVKTAEKIGKAQAHDLDASYKDLTQVLRAIRGKNVAKAFDILEAAIAMEHAIPYRKFNTGLGHRSELGGKKGRYPKKECKMAYATLKNAVANAVHQGLDETTLKVTHAAAYKQNTFRRHRTFWVGSTTLGYGKYAMWADYVTAWMEIMVAGAASEKKDAKNTAKASAAKVPAQTKKAAQKKTEGAPKADVKPEAKKAEQKPAEKAAPEKEASSPTASKIQG